MSNTATNTYTPDYLVTPGEVLKEYLDDIPMTQVELANKTGLAKKTIHDIIKAKLSITPEIALKLEQALGRPAHFWSNIERQYQDDLTRHSEQKRMNLLEWLTKALTSIMAKWGYFPRACRQ